MLNSGKNWTSYGEDRLISLAVRGKTQRQIAYTLGRTPKAIERKAHRLRSKFTRNVPFANLMAIMYTGITYLENLRDN